MIQYPTHLRRPSQGFTLIELMIALVLGLLMIGATVTVFVSNQQTSRTMTELGNAQEAFRFASHTIMRVVQQGRIANPQVAQAGETQPVADNLLRVVVNPGAGKKDCLGRSVDPASDRTINTFFIDGDQLRCSVVVLDSDDALISADDATLVEGLDFGRSEFTFGIGNLVDEFGNPVGFWSNNSSWVSDIDVTDWVNVRSVRVQLAKQARGDAIGAIALFSATMRCGALDIC